MTQDEIIRMAREAEQYANTFCESIGDADQNHWFDAYNERFAALVAAHEREAILEIVKTIGGEFAVDCAAAIRARSNKL